MAPTKRGPGRPPGQPSKARKEAVLVKLHPDEKRAIEKNAGAVPVATYMRDKALTP